MGKDDNYLRYSDDFPAFMGECYDQAEGKYKMSNKIARAIWTELQAMPDPANFSFGPAFEKHSIKTNK